MRQREGDTESRRQKGREKKKPKDKETQVAMKKGKQVWAGGEVGDHRRRGKGSLRWDQTL